VSAAVKDGNSDYTLPESMGFRLKAVNATFADNGAGQAYLPAVVLISDSGHVIAHAVDTDVSVAAGGSAETSFFPGVRRRLTGSGLTLDYNLGEIGGSIGTGLFAGQTTTVTYQDIAVGEGILVLAAAPSVRAALATPAHPLSVSDTVGNTYTTLCFAAFEANPPGVNTGLYVTLFYCPSNIFTMAAGGDQVTVTWDGTCYDRIVEVWSVRHSGGAHTPTLLDQTNDHDAAVFASDRVTLVAPDFFPSRDQALEFAIILSAKAGGVGGYSGAAGFSGFFQAESRLYSGSKQDTLVNPQTHGANAYLIAGAVPAPFENDVGVLPGGVLVPSFSGVGQSYFNLGGGGIVPVTNEWKGIILLGLD
jgi:hypothetical protein